MRISELLIVVTAVILMVYLMLYLMLYRMVYLTVYLWFIRLSSLKLPWTAGRESDLSVLLGHESANSSGASSSR